MKPEDIQWKDRSELVLKREEDLTDRDCLFLAFSSGPRYLYIVKEDLAFCGIFSIGDFNRAQAKGGECRPNRACSFIHASSGGGCIPASYGGARIF